MKGQRSALIGDQILDCQDISSLSLRRPIDRGFIVNIDMQRDIWTRAFRNVLRVKPSDCGLVLTEPLFNLPAIRDSMAQVGPSVRLCCRRAFKTRCLLCTSC